MPASPPPPYEELQQPPPSYRSSQRLENNNNNVVVINIGNLVVNPGEVSHAISMAALEDVLEATPSSNLRCAYPYCRNFVSIVDAEANKSCCIQHSQFHVYQNCQIKVTSAEEKKEVETIKCICCSILFIIIIICVIGSICKRFK